VDNISRLQPQLFAEHGPAGAGRRCLASGEAPDRRDGRCLPVVTKLAGGYQKPVSRVELHVATLQAYAAVYGYTSPTAATVDPEQCS